MTRAVAMPTDEVCSDERQEYYDEQERVDRIRTIRISVSVTLTVIIIILTVIIYLKTRNKSVYDVILAVFL